MRFISRLKRLLRQFFVLPKERFESPGQRELREISRLGQNLIVMQLEK